MYDSHRQGRSTDQVRTLDIPMATFLSFPHNFITVEQSNVVKTALLERFIPSVCTPDAPAIFDKIYRGEISVMSELRVADEYACTDEEAFVEALLEEYDRQLYMVGQCIYLTKATQQELSQ